MAEKNIVDAIARGIVVFDGAMGTTLQRMQLAGELKIRVREEVMPREVLYAAEELFYAGTAVEVSPIASVDRIPVGNGERGPVTRAGAGPDTSPSCAMRAGTTSCTTPMMRITMAGRRCA